MEGIVHYGGGREDAVVGTAGCYGHLLMTLWTRKQRQDRKWDLAANLKAHPRAPEITSYNYAPHPKGSMTS